MSEYSGFECSHTPALCGGVLVIIAKQMQEPVQNQVDDTFFQRLLQRLRFARCHWQRHNNVS
jgi:hypothetical protein